MASELSFDTMIEVISRTSLKTLDVFRCTSNEIDKLTYNSYFLDVYKQRKKLISGFLLQYVGCCERKHKFAPSRYSNTLDLSFLSSNTRILASSENGIIVFETHNPRDYRKVLYHVSKPSTKQVLALPNPKTKYFTKKVAIIVLGSTPLHYKIVRLSLPKELTLLRQGKVSSIFRCEIFDSLTAEWRSTDPLILDPDDFLNAQEPITSRGSVYMLTSHNILQFDATLDKWSTFSLPIATMDYPFETTSQQLVKHKGKLAFACGPRNRSWEIWVHTIDESWAKVCTFNKEKETKSLEALNDSDTCVMMDHHDNVIYKSKRDGDIRKIKLTNKPDEMHVFRSDFETVELTGGR